MRGFFPFSLLLCAGVTHAQPEHDWHWAVRARLAHMDETLDSGKAGSLLLRGAVESQWGQSFGTLLELDGVGSVWQDYHSDGERLSGQPLIQDVPGIDLNQALLSYDGRAWRMRLGRQAIHLDDQRFVGGNGFWQNEQTFDALRLERRLLSASRLHYAYVANVNRIFGEDAVGAGQPQQFLGDHEHHTHLLHLELYEWDASRFQLYAYWIDNLDLPASSNNTLGGKFEQSATLGAIKYEVVIALAGQERPEIAASPEPWYGLLEMSALHGAWRGVLRYEVLGADHQVAFATPIASGHDFQGWADVFSQAPATGLEDASTQLHWRASPWELDLRYHGFWEAGGGNFLGEEVDMELTFKPLRRQLFALRYADFKTQVPHYADTRKVFFTYSWNF